MKIWVARRSPNVNTYPNRFDTTVAGGVSAEESLFETVIHEADEEASLPANLLRSGVRSCGVLAYISVTSEAGIGANGLVVPDTVILDDLENSPGVVPKPRDDEVKVFYLMDVEEVRGALAAEEFKTNS
jgi:8-oxo-dGTP pyrophosphatase MutT (NUDIX family)